MNFIIILTSIQVHGQVKTLKQFMMKYSQYQEKEHKCGCLQHQIQLAILWIQIVQIINDILIFEQLAVERKKPHII